MQDQTSFEVRFCAVKATSAYLLLHEKDTTILNHNKELLTPMLTVIMETIEKGDDDAGLFTLKSAICLLGMNSNMFGNL